MQARASRQCPATEESAVTHKTQNPKPKTPHLTALNRQLPRFLLCTWALAHLSTFVFGADTKIDTTRKEGIVVSDSRLPHRTTPLRKFPANVTLISRDEIAASPARHIAELLSQRVGVLQTDTVGFGQFANLTMRGFAEKTGALVLVDGQRVNDAGASDLPFLWNSIPLDTIERIEIIRGGASSVYGEGAIAGVVNIITKQGAEKPFRPAVQASGGNLGFFTAHAEASGQHDKFRYFASLDHRQWDGWRDLSGFRGWSAIVKPSLETDLGNFALNYYFHKEKSENPGNLTAAAFAANPRQAGAFPTLFESEVHRFALDYAREFDNGWTLLIKPFGQAFDSRSESGFGVSEIAQPNYGITAQVSAAQKIFERDNQFTVGAELIQQDFRSDFISGFGVFTTIADHWTGSIFLQNTLDLTDRVAVTAGARYDHREWDVQSLSPFPPDIIEKKHADVFSPKAGVTVQLAEQTTAYASISRAFRLPSGFDIGAAGAAPGQLFFANPSIKPVDSRTFEIGARTSRSKWLGGSVAYYHSDVSNDILFNPFTFMNENFDSIRQGVELTLNSQPHEQVDFYFTTAWTDAKFDGGAFDGKQLPLTVRWQITGGVNVRPVKNLQLTLEALHGSGQVPINDTTNAFARNDFTVLNARVNFSRGNFSVFAAVNNLLDERYEMFPAVTSGAPQSRSFNPAPGINFQIGGGIRF
jgi:iron complex outermembrane receptor protein